MQILTGFRLQGRRGPSFATLSFGCISYLTGFLLRDLVQDTIIKKPDYSLLIPYYGHLN